MKTEFNTHVSQRKREAPFSLGLTFEERAKLEDAANGVSYSRMFGQIPA